MDYLSSEMDAPAHSRAGDMLHKYRVDIAIGVLIFGIAGISVFLLGYASYQHDNRSLGGPHEMGISAPAMSYLAGDTICEGGEDFCVVVKSKNPSAVLRGLIQSMPRVDGKNYSVVVSIEHKGDAQ